MKQFLLASAFLTLSLMGFAQTNLTLLSNYQYPANRGDGSDIWGYVDEFGNEYAIMGLQAGTSIMDVTDPANPVEVFYSPGANTIWRDMKVWGDFTYITNEGGNGLKIIDLTNLPGPITGADVYYHTGTSFPFQTAHNIYIDENGVAYIVGADNGVGGAIMLDVDANPTAPIELGRYNDYYLHDVYVRNDTLWGGAINDGFLAVVDVVDKANPVTIATQNTPSTFTHNAWLSDDGNTVYTTDELSDAYIAAYDVSDLQNITEVDRIQSNPGTGTIPHNVFVIGNYLVTSYYRDGVTIHDATYPSNLIEVGNYDTSPLSGDGFNGCWGVYPYFPSGNIVASDIESGLFVFGVNYTPGAYLIGNVTDQATTNPINGANVDIVTTGIIDNSDVNGDYLTGLATGGTYDVTFSKPGYISQTINNVSITNGNTTILDVALVPLPTFTYQGTVIDDLGNPVIGAIVEITNASFTYNVSTNGVGEFSISSFLEGVYDINIGLWGYQTLCLANENILEVNNPYTYTLNQGYSDNFSLDLGWTVSGNAFTGDWVRDVPNGTSYFGDDSNPGNDSPNDCGDKAYVTGNAAGGGAGNDDIDDGTTILTSPVFDLTSYGDPIIEFDRWFFNGGGSGQPNDSLVVELLNGTNTVIIDFATVNDPGLSSWAAKSIQVSSFITPTNTMQLRVRAMDIPGGHLAEGGFDNLFMYDAAAGISETAYQTIGLYPSPFSDELTIRIDTKAEEINVKVVNASTGQLVEEFSYPNEVEHNWKNAYASGVYLIQIYADGEWQGTKRVVKL